VAVRAGDLDRDVRRLCVLGDVRERFRDDVVDRRLHGRRHALDRRRQLDRHGASRSDRLERRTEAAIAQDRRMDPARELAQLLERLVELLAHLDDVLRGCVGIGMDLRFDQTQVERDRDEPLLGAVMEIPLESAALGVAGRHDASARLAQIVHVRLQLGVEAAVLESQSGGRSHRLEQLGGVAKRRIVDDRRDPAALPVDHRRDLVAPFPGQLEGPPPDVDEAPGLGNPVREPQRRIAQRAAKGVA
jgi:hypothetical protein